jgi:hypothetical protein
MCNRIILPKKTGGIGYTRNMWEEAIPFRGVADRYRREKGLTVVAGTEKADRMKIDLIVSLAYNVDITLIGDPDIRR